MGDVRLLLIEDDVRMATAIRRGLRTEGIVADVAGRGDTALGMARATDYDALVPVSYTHLTLPTIYSV